MLNIQMRVKIDNESLLSFANSVKHLCIVL
jgi:hypothetical protein